MRYAAIKTEAQQATGMVFRTRDLLVRQRTQLINAIRGHLTEFGWVMWIRFANSHTGQRHYARANRPDRWQHPTTANTRFSLSHLLGRPQMDSGMAALLARDE